MGGMALLWARREERLGEQPLCVSFGRFGRFGRKEIGLSLRMRSFRKVKYSFVSNFWLWAKSCIDEGPNSLINFFYWLGSS